MVKIARKNVNKTAHAGDNVTCAGLYAACQFVRILKVAIKVPARSGIFSIQATTKMMQTMTSTMIIMPSRGGR